jgi:RNA polymerase sigma-70 factor (ECF subfamily)
MFLCAHPAISAAAHTGLMLQTVLGFTAEEIAAATLESPAAIGQRLARAKRLISGGTIPFALPPGHILRERMAAVQRAIYAAYTSGWENMTGGADTVTGLAAEAEWLARCLVRLAPEDAEAKGLLALILYCESRRPARRDSLGRYVPLDQQDTSLWDESGIREATTLLTAASEACAPGRFQIEAAIQAVHAARRETGCTDWPLICQLYRALHETAPTAGARIAEAAAWLQAGAPATALGLLDEIAGKTTERHAPYWAVRAHVLYAIGEVEAGHTALQQAAALTPDEATRRWLLTRHSDM